MTGLQAARPGHAELRVRRLLAFTIGISIGTNLLTDAAIFRVQFAEFAPWWSVPAVAGQIIAMLALLAVPWISRGPALRALCIAVPVFGLLSIALIVPAAGVHGLPDAVGAAWPLRVQASYALPLMLALSAGFGWVYVGLLAGFAFVARVLTSATTNVRLTIEDAVVNTTVTVMLAVLVVLLVSIGRTLDRSAEEAIEAVRRDSAGEARAIERRRIELLAHDDILHVLRVVAMGMRSETADPARLAAMTLERLDSLDVLEDAPEETSVPAEEFLRRLTAVVTAVAPLAVFEAEDLGDLIVPGRAATAMLEASGEALRNSVLHAGGQEGGVTRHVRVVHDAGVLSVSIDDDGRGFLPGEVSTRRVGVARSIVARMRAVPGGSASVDSAPGSGTRVVLTWR
jgi:signal transduction histidine kinase